MNRQHIKEKKKVHQISGLSRKDAHFIGFTAVN